MSQSSNFAQLSNALLMQAKTDASAASDTKRSKFNLSVADEALIEAVFR
jgi:hypothetical protein